jgi:tetratricopeptide (TPR) repeat protein
MQIKRDYSQPFFGSRRRRRTSGRFLFFYGLLIGGILAFTYTQFDRLQLAALDIVGLAPTATPYASTLATQGTRLYQAGDIAGAAELFEMAVRQQPDNIDYLYEYGKLLIDLNRPRDVLEPRLLDAPIADHAIAVAPRDPRGYALKTKALVWIADYSGAIPVGVAGREVDPDFAPLLAAMARAYSQIGRYQQGLEYGAQAVEADPLDLDARRSYAFTLIYVGETQRAIQQLEEAIAINPNLTAPYFELALQYLATDQNEMAIATYERILSLEPRNARAHLRLCEAYAKVGQQDRAQDYCEDALEIDPNYADAWKRVGMARYTRRNYEGAIEAFNTCVANLPPDANLAFNVECWYLRGLAHYYLGQCNEAWDVLTESLPMAEALPGGQNVVASIREGLRLTTVSCAQYVGRPLPTEIPPTPIPPTPIGF